MSSGPTIYATLMNEAYTDARQKPSNGGFMDVGGLDDVLETYVSTADHRYVDAAVSSALREIYIRGVQHGYVQAVERLDSTRAVVTGG